MKNGLVIVDSGPIISLALVDHLWVLEEVFDKVRIPKAVWEELTMDESKPFVPKIKEYFQDKVQEIEGGNDLAFLIGYGESESIVLYREAGASFLLIDDKRARKFAENFGINCIGTIGLLSNSKDKGIVKDLKPIFQNFIRNKRFYPIDLLNKVLELKGEDQLYQGTR